MRKVDCFNKLISITLVNPLDASGKPARSKRKRSFQSFRNFQRATPKGRIVWSLLFSRCLSCFRALPLACARLLPHLWNLLLACGLFDSRDCTRAMWVADAWSGTLQFDRCLWSLFRVLFCVTQESPFLGTGIIPLDRTFQVILYGCGCGMSASFWRNQHNKHHATPQKLSHDPDLDTLPFVAFNRAILNRLKSPFFRNVWIPLQAYIFTPVITFLVSIYWQSYLHPRHSLRTRNYSEVFL